MTITRPRFLARLFSRHRVEIDHRPLVLATDLQDSLRTQLAESEQGSAPPDAEPPLSHPPRDERDAHPADPSYLFDLQQPVAWGWRRGWVIGRSWDLKRNLALYDVATDRGLIHRNVRGDDLTGREDRPWGQRADSQRRPAAA